MERHRGCVAILIWVPVGLALWALLWWLLR